ncbi:hypothetical protein P691DRAFT_760915 [Macrolepiota fuliginosa MF-IS2]|uniref:Uncharacterized protein n=1 Tax=Macrolepiota fuliginosa MF-IS2 TaxID=1400762 RepID=A0A9P5XDG5_9AGAR|nr:hypothetical protein P691DRAFT_760915 [Macrolepiota fuliginosa MF-IS2]
MLDSTSLIANPLAAWILLFLDFVWTLGDECTYIRRWVSAKDSLCIATYVFARYSPFLTQVINIVLVFHFTTPFSQELCRKWFFFLHMCNLSVQLPFEVVVGLRVYALYQHDLRVGLFALALIIVDGTAALFAGISLALTANFDASCSTRTSGVGLALPWVPPINFIVRYQPVLHSVIFQFSQGILWAMTWYKRRVITQSVDQSFRAQLPVLPILFRDGTIVLAVLSMGAALALPYSAVVGIDTLIIYPWSVCLLSAFCCHLILNMLSAKKITSDPGEEIWELTTFSSCGSSQETATKQLEPVTRDSTSLKTEADHTSAATTIALDSQAPGTLSPIPEESEGEN